MVEQVYIYGLHEEGSNEIRYVGQTAKPGVRLTQHMALQVVAESNPKRQWIKDCFRRKVKVKMAILERCDKTKALEREQHWIDYHRSLGYCLTNVNQAYGEHATHNVSIYVGKQTEKDQVVRILENVAALIEIDNTASLIRWLGKQDRYVLAEALRPLRRAELLAKVEAMR